MSAEIVSPLYIFRNNGSFYLSHSIYVGIWGHPRFLGLFEFPFK